MIIKMKELVFATNNEHKLRELRQILTGEFELLSLKDIGCNEEIPETGNTLESNASQKSHYIWNKYGLDCFADDTGLEINALNNEPGVYSARYAGEEKSSEANMQKVLDKLNGIINRQARFRCVFSLIIDGHEKQFEGIVEGIILNARQGEGGFGYDPIFKPDGFLYSFATLSPSEKNSISHRGRAVKKLVDYLKNSHPA
jgi:XTP/dITP diphosphohydrolase